MNDWTWNLDVDEEEYLAHHGVLGQKWGIRRYQNPDGSLTAAGRKRIYGDSKEIETEEHRQRRAVESYRQSKIATKYAGKAFSSSQRGNEKKAAQYRDMMRKASKNADIYGKGLSKDERNYNYAKELEKQQRRGKVGAAIGGTAGALGFGALGATTGGPAGLAAGAYGALWGGAVGHVAGTSIKSKRGKELSKKGHAAYVKYFNKELKKKSGNKHYNDYDSYQKYIASITATNAAMESSRRGASLAASGGMNPYLFG